MHNFKVIESKDNQKVKLISSLKLRKNREKHKLVLIEGLRAIKQVLETNMKINILAFSESDIVSNKEYMDMFLEYESISIVIKTSVFDNITETVNTQGIAAIVETPEYRLDCLFSQDRSRLVVFDRIQDPGNAGTLIRTADAAGFDAILYTKGTVDLFSSKVNRSAMGLNLSVPLIEISVNDIENLKSKGFVIYSTTLDNYSLIYDSVKFADKTVVILGNEANGISEDLLSLSDEKIYIPIYGKAESLNVGIAGAIIMYESIKQKG